MSDGSYLSNEEPLLDGVGANFQGDPAYTPANGSDPMDESVTDRNARRSDSGWLDSAEKFGRRVGQAQVAGMVSPALGLATALGYLDKAGVDPKGAISRLQLGALYLLALIVIGVGLYSFTSGTVVVKTAKGA